MANFAAGFSNFCKFCSGLCKFCKIAQIWKLSAQSTKLGWTLLILKFNFQILHKSLNFAQNFAQQNPGGSIDYKSGYHTISIYIISIINYLYLVKLVSRIINSLYNFKSYKYLCIS